MPAGNISALRLSTEAAKGGEDVASLLGHASDEATASRRVAVVAPSGWLVLQHGVINTRLDRRRSDGTVAWGWRCSRISRCLGAPSAVGGVGPGSGFTKGAERLIVADQSYHQGMGRDRGRRDRSRSRSAERWG